MKVEEVVSLAPDAGDDIVRAQIAILKQVAKLDYTLEQRIQMFPPRRVLESGSFSPWAFLANLWNGQKANSFDDLLGWFYEVDRLSEGAFGPKARGQFFSRFFVDPKYGLSQEQYLNIVQNSSLGEILELRRLVLHNTTLDLHLLEFACERVRTSQELDAVFEGSFLEGLAEYISSEEMVEYIETCGRLRDAVESRLSVQ